MPETRRCLGCFQIQFNGIIPPLQNNVGVGSLRVVNRLLGEDRPRDRPYTQAIWSCQAHWTTRFRRSGMVNTHLNRLVGSWLLGLPAITAFF